MNIQIEELIHSYTHIISAHNEDLRQLTIKTNELIEKIIFMPCDTAQYKKSMIELKHCHKTTVSIMDMIIQLKTKQAIINRNLEQSSIIACFIAKKIILDPETRFEMRIQDIHLEFKLWYSMALPGERMPKISDVKDAIVKRFYEPNEKNVWAGLKFNNEDVIEDYSDDLEKLNSTKSK